MNRNIETCVSCGDSHRRAKVYQSRGPAVSIGYYVCPVTREAISLFDDDGKQDAYHHFWEMVNRRRFLLITSVADCEDDTNSQHQVDSWYLTHEFPTGDIQNVLNFIGEHVATLQAKAAVAKLPEAKLEVFDPLAHLSPELKPLSEIIDARKAEPTMAAPAGDVVAAVSDNASPDGTTPDGSNGQGGGPGDPNVEANE